MCERPQYYRCGICDHWHNAKWDGDCREDENRFFIEQIDEKHGQDGWDEVPMPGTEHPECGEDNDH